MFLHTILSNFHPMSQAAAGNYHRTAAFPRGHHTHRSLHPLLAPAPEILHQAGKVHPNIGWGREFQDLMDLAGAPSVLRVPGLIYSAAPWAVWSRATSPRSWGWDRLQFRGNCAGGCRAYGKYILGHLDACVCSGYLMPNTGQGFTSILCRQATARNTDRRARHAA
jgi:hypothetical protein